MLSSQDYNYSVFEVDPNEFVDFATKAPKATMRAPSFAVESLESGETVEMKEFWRSGVTVIEFGSFT